MKKILISILIILGLFLGAVALADGFPIWFPNDDNNAQLVDLWGVDMQDQDILNVKDIGKAVNKVANVWANNIHADYLDIAFGVTNLGLIIRNDFTGTPAPADDMYLTFNRGTQVDAGVLWSEGSKELYFSHPDGNKLGNSSTTLLSLKTGSESKFSVDNDGSVTQGVWNATTVAVNRGGTGTTTLSGIVLGNGTSAFTTTPNNSANWDLAYQNRLVSASAPLTLSANSLSISKASSTASGYLSNTDWTTFNNKISSQWTTNGSNISYVAGSVGIGTTNPVSKLDAVLTSAGAETFPIVVRNVSDTISTKAGVAFIPSVASGITRYSAIEGVQETGNNQIGLAFITGSASIISEKMRIRYDGNVGIGTTNPVAKLYIKDLNKNPLADLSNPSNYQTFIDGSATDGTAMGIGFGNIAAFNNIGSAILSIDRGSGQNSDLAFFTKGSGIGGAAPTERMRIDMNGNVGIGLTNPSYKLDVSGGDINVSGVFRKGGTAGVSDLAAGVPTSLTVSGGIVTAMTKTTGLSVTKTIKGSDGNDCNLVFTSGLLTSTTCP